MLTKISRSAAGPYLLLILTALATLFFRLGGLPFLGADEPRYARIAEEMNQAGNWVTPLLQGYPWLEKPPLYYWITMAVYRVLGVSETTARLGPAVCALLASAFIVWLGSRLWSRLAGLLGGLILLSTIGFCALGRSASTDMPFTTCFTLAFSLLAVAAVRGGVSAWGVGCAYVSLGLAVLAKGPVALALGAGIMLLFWVLDEKGGSLGKMHLLWGGTIVAMVALPWFWLAFRENGFSFVSVFFLNHHFARYVSDMHHHEEPFYYFFPILLGLFFPWSGWLPALLPASMRGKVVDWRTWDRGTILLGCWLLFPILFFSLSTSKLPGYILPSLPPLALLLGHGLAELIHSSGGDRTLKMTHWFCLFLSLGVAAAFPLVMRQSFGASWQTGLTMAAAVLLPALFVFWFARRGWLLAAVQATVVQGLILVLAVTQFGFPALAAYQSTRDIAHQALTAGAGGEPIITYAYFQHTLHYYTSYRIRENVVDLPSLAEYARQQPRFLVVTEAARLPELQSLPELSIAVLGGQGPIRLLRVTAVRR